MTVREYLGARYVPLYMGEWDINATYEPLSIVSNEGNSYTSRQYVPEGIDISNTVYWALTGNYNAQIEQYRQEVEAFDGRIDTLEGKFDANGDVAANLVNTSSIEDDAVTNDKVADNAVNTAQIADDAVTADKIADDAVNTAQIADDAITTNKIADDAVTADKIADDAVTADKLDENLRLELDAMNSNSANYYVVPEYLGKVDRASGHEIGAMATDNIQVFVLNRANGDADTYVDVYNFVDFVSGNFTKIASYSIGQSHANDCCYYGGNLYITDWLSASSYKTVKVWNTTSHTVTKTITVKAPNQVNGFQISPDNVVMFFGSNGLSRIRGKLDTGNGIVYPTHAYPEEPEFLGEVYAQGGYCNQTTFYKVFTSQQDAQESGKSSGIAVFARNGIHVANIVFPNNMDWHIPEDDIRNELQGCFLYNGTMFVIGNRGGVYTIDNFPYAETMNDYQPASVYRIGSYSSADMTANAQYLETATYNGHSVVSKIKAPFVRTTNPNQPPLVGFGNTTRQANYMQNNHETVMVYDSTGFWFLDYLYAASSVNDGCELTLVPENCYAFNIGTGTKTIGVSALNTISRNVAFLLSSPYWQVPNGMVPFTI